MDLETPPAAAQESLPAPVLGQELLEQRTARSKTFATDRQGAFVTEISPVPVHYKDAQGRWQEISADLVAVKDGRAHNKANAFDVSLAASAADASVARLSLDDNHSVGFTVQAAAKVNGIKTKDAVTYARALKDTDVRFTSTSTGLKEEVVLASSAAPDRFVFPLELRGLKASLDAGGNVIYRDDSGVERARTPHGFMSDAALDARSAERPTSFGVTYALIPFGKGTALEVRLDRAWLNDPARVWPVTVDPTMTPVYTGSDDTYVQYWYPANNSGDTQLKVGTYNGGADKAKSFLHFDTSVVNGKVISSARLKMYEWHSYSCDPRPVSVHRVTQGWSGSTMQGFPGASLDANPLDTLNVAKGWSSSCPAGWLDFNVTSAVASWASGGSNYGLALQADESDSYGWKKLHSSEAGPSSNPVIEITWSDPATRPSPPQAVAASPRNAAAVVTWAPPASNGGSALTSYVVGSYIWNGSAWVLLNWYYPCGTCTSLTVSGLSNGYSYAFGVWARNAAGQSDGVTSNTIIAGTPSAPQSVGASARNLGAFVTWAPPVSAGASAVDAYGVFAYEYPSLEYVGYTQACGTCTSVKVTGLANGQQYIFGVYAHSIVNWGPGVATNVVTPAPTVPDAPPNVFAAPAANGTVDVAWSAPPDNGAAIDSYLLGVYKTTPSLTYLKSETVCGSCSSKNIGGLTAGQGYQFYVWAHNPYGYGGFTGSNVVSAGGSPDLLKPTSVAATGGDGRATVTWTQPVIRVGGLTSYVVTIGTESAPTTVVGTATVTDPTTTVTIAGLTNGERYVAKVVATTLVLNADSAFSPPFTPAGSPFAPDQVYADPGDRQVTINWQPPPARASGVPGDNGASITGYEIAIFANGQPVGTRAADAGQRSLTITELANGTTTYRFTVAARNAVGLGQPSGQSNGIVPAGRPFQPLYVNASVVDTDEVLVSWIAPQTQPSGAPGDNGSDVNWYAVVPTPTCASCTGVIVPADSSPSARTTVRGLTPATSYTFQVLATNALGTSDRSDPSAPVSTLTAEPPPRPGYPGPATAVTVYFADREARISWSPSSPNGSPIIDYTITAVRADGSDAASLTVPGTVTNTVMSALSNTTSYSFWVVARNSVGTSVIATSSPSSRYGSLMGEADAYMTMPLSGFLAAKAQAPQPFIWTDDGCSAVGFVVPDEFNEACTRHDFGYRNYGTGLRLRPDEDTRYWIDRILYNDLLDTCDRIRSGAELTICRNIAARSVYDFVRAFGWIGYG